MRQFVVVSLIFIFFTLLFTYPSVLHLTDKIIGDGGDNYQFLGFQYLAKLQIDDGKFPFGWTNYWRYPVGIDFSIAYDSTLLLLVGLIFYQFTSDPVIVYNLTLLTFLYLNCLLSYVFFTRITGYKTLGVIGALIYGFSFYSIARMGGHPNLIVIGCFPFFIYSLLILLEKGGSKKSFVIFTLATILVFLVSLQYLLLLSGAFILFLPVLALFYKDVLILYARLFWKRRKYAFFSLLAIVSVFLFFHSNRIEAYFNQSFILPGRDIISVPIINFFFPNSYIKIVLSPLLNTTSEWIDNVVFIGYVELIAFIFFFFTDEASRKFKVFIFTVIGVFFIIALGNQNNPGSILPYSYLFGFLPFRGIIEPGRFYIILYLVLTTAAVFFLKKFLYKTERIGILLIIFFVAYERLPTQFYLSNTHADELFIEAVRSHQSDGVLDLPLFREWYNGNKYDLYSIYYQKPIVNGYIHWSGDTESARVFLNRIKRLQCIQDPEILPQQLSQEQMAQEIELNNKLIQDLRGYGIRTLVYHRDLGTSIYCQEAVERINILLYQSDLPLTKLFEDANKTVFNLEE